MIDTDASSYQLGASLLQQQDEESPNVWTPIGYWSKSLNDAERNYSATERECYSVVWAITILRPYTGSCAPSPRRAIASGDGL